LPWSIDFRVLNSATIRRWQVDLGSAEPPEQTDALRAGGQILILSNPHPRELVIRVERTAIRSDALTAAQATSMSLFRELFPGEVLAPGQLATVSMVTLMVTSIDPRQADALYHDLGDTRAFGVIHEHLKRLGEAIRAGGGAVVKTMGEGVLASFNQVDDAVRTALDMMPRLGGGPSPHMLRVRVGIHRGTTLAATLNDQLDYFGTTARQAVGTLQYSRGGELVLTQPVAADPAVAALLNARHIQGEVIAADLAGQPHLIRVRLDSTSQPA
jgi:eukaryotic-like serine/threonine-protein kinase